ncbi:MAG: sulfurtransferase [Cyclobacteriaceae bacterium]|nr:sulfurtransferase [Cyclobacteriaceae bacterium]
MKRLLIVLLAGCASVAFAQESLLVTPEWLNEHKSDNDLVIVQPNYLKYDYDAGHIEGARYLWPPALSPDSPEGSLNAPTSQAATELLGSLGITRNSRIVLCHVRNEVSQTARVFVVLEQLGMKGKVFFLNGGLEAWKKAGFPVTKEAPVIKPARFEVSVTPLLVDKEYVKKNLNATGTLIVDARMKNYYDGEPAGQPRDGHISGAKNIPYTEMLDPATYVFKPADQLKKYFEPVATPDKELVAYCFIGQTASVVYMAGRILGYNMKVYDGSIQEWSRIPDLPMEKTEKK